MSEDVTALAAQRLTGRPPLESDLADWTRWNLDPRIEEEAWPARLRTAADAERTLSTSIAHWRAHGFGMWTVSDALGPVGRVGLQRTELRGVEVVELMWMFDGSSWGRGYAAEAGRAALDVAFGRLGLKEVVAMTTPANARSQAVAERLGMIPDGLVDHAGLPHLVFRLAPGTASAR